VVLQALALMRDATSAHPLPVRASAAVAFLLGFDVYARGGDLTQVMRNQVLPPRPHQTGAVAAWSVTLFPATQAGVSTTGKQDDTVLIATSNPARAWLTQLLPPITAQRHPSGSLLGLTQSTFVRLFHASRRAAKLPPSWPHRLQHGGASADALAGCSDLTIADRGRWASVASVRRYRRPGQYLRQLRLLSYAQFAEARAAPDLIVSIVKEALLPTRKRKR